MRGFGTGLALGLMLSAATAVEAQSCANCGGFHGGTSSAQLTKEAESRKAQVDDLMKRFEAKAREQREASQKASADRIARIHAEAEAMQSALDRTKRQELLAKRAAEGQKRMEAAGAKASAEEKRKLEAETGMLTKPMLGPEAMRDRLRLAGENAALRQLERKEANDRTVPKSLEQVPAGAIYKSLVTPFERAGDKLRNIFDGADVVQPF